MLQQTPPRSRSIKFSEILGSSAGGFRLSTCGLVARSLKYRLLGHSTINKNQPTRGMSLDDNVFGSFESDAFRRDFTVNALYYCATDERVLDPH